MVAKVNKMPLLADGQYDVKELVSLNFFDLSGQKAKTKGTSCKTWAAEVQISKTDSAAQIYSMWGATGSNLTKEWRHYESYDKALKEFNSLVKSKKRKGYVEVDVAQRAYGSEEAKKIIKPVALINTDNIAKTQSKLHDKVQYLVAKLFGNTSNWVSQTLKCPLGQLTNDQVDKGRNILKEAKIILDKKIKSASDKTQLENLTNDFYSAIPHNLGSGARGQMIHLLLDDAIKIAQKESDLDTLLDAKSVGAVLQTGSNVDDQYTTLNADIGYIPEDDYRFKWINDLVLKTRASNHHWLGKIKVLNIWDLARKLENDRFIDAVTDISKESKGQIIPDMYKGLGVENRADVDSDLYKRANVLPLFHGTRTENLVGITKNGLLIRPHNAVLTGAMYGNAIYGSNFSTKSINYTNIKSSYWARGNADTAYLFIIDACLGNQLVANGSYQYTTKNIIPNHSVWAKSGVSGIINDEFMIYTTNQVKLRYLIEFNCK